MFGVAYRMFGSSIPSLRRRKIVSPVLVLHRVQFARVNTTFKRTASPTASVPRKVFGPVEVASKRESASTLELHVIAVHAQYPKHMACSLSIEVLPLHSHIPPSGPTSSTKCGEVFHAITWTASVYVARDPRGLRSAPRFANEVEP
jgi:hypothetical protein